MKIDDVVKRRDNGRPVRIVDLRLVGLRIFYQTEDMEDGHTALFDERDLRPVYNTEAPTRDR